MSSNKSAERAQERAERDEYLRRKRIEDGKGRIKQVFSEFDDGFFDNIRNAQLGVLMPDISRQFQDAREKLVYALSRGGTLNSSIAGQRQGDIADERVRAVTQADSFADSAVKSARSAIEDERSILTSQLQATADPELAAQGAAARADFLRVPDPIQTIGPIFQNATAGLGAALQQRYDANGQRVQRSGGLFSGGSTNRSRTVGG